MENNDLSEKLKLWRAKHHKTQKEAAAMIGISRSYYNELENGIKTPSEHVLRLLATAMRVTPEYLRGEPELEPEREPELVDLRKAVVNVDIALIPLVGEIRAGVSMYAQNNIESYVRVDGSSIDSNKAYFFLKVVGDSMNRVIREGDIVLVEHTPCFETGNIVIALFENGDATIKKVRIKGDRIILIPDSYNPEYTIHSYSEDEVSIVGKVIRAERHF